MTAELGPLRTIAIESGDVDLFPEPVLQLYDQGRRKDALYTLKQVIQLERDPTRRALQTRYAGELALWAIPMKGPPGLFTLNGFGVRLYAGPTRPDGLRLGIRWLTALYVPIVPIGAYLVTSTSDGWWFHGEIPLPRWSWFVPGTWALLTAAVVLPTAWHARTHADLVAYNGFDVPIEVAVGADRVTLAPLGHHLFSNLRAEELAVAAFAPDGRVFDSEVVDLAHHAGELAVYNVAGRGIVALETVRYSRTGDSEPPEGGLLPPLAVQYLEEPEHVFEEPPESRKLSSSTPYVDERVLRGVPLSDTLVGSYDLLIGQDEPVRALALLDAELALHPDDIGVLRLGATHRERFRPEETGAWLQELRDARPDDVDVHRLYQAYAPVSHDALVAEYDAMLAAAPDSVMARTLAGHARHDTAEAVGWYTDALARDPEYRPALRALADWRARAGEYAAADELYARLQADADASDDWSTERMRLAWSLGRDPVSPEGGRSLHGGDMLRVARAPTEVDRILVEVLARDPTLADAQAQWLESELRLVAGDLARTRTLVQGAPRADVELRFALSDGATDEDRREALEKLPAPEALPIYLRTLGWALVNRIDPASQEFWDASLVGTGPGTVFPAILADPAGMRDPARLEAMMLHRVSLEERGAVYAAMAVLVPDGRAGAEYRRLAGRFGMPWESPWFRR